MTGWFVNVTSFISTRESMQKMRGRNYFRDLNIKFDNDFNPVK